MQSKLVAIFDRAIELLKTVGWTKGAFVRTRDGGSLNSHLTIPLSKVDGFCLVGAVQRAAHELYPNPDPFTNPGSRAMDIVRAVQPLPTVFNDSDAQSVGEVTEVLRRAKDKALTGGGEPVGR